MSKLIGNAIVGQSGGPTCVINQSLVGVIEEHFNHGCIETLYGARHGSAGILKEDFVDLSALAVKNGNVDMEYLNKLAYTPSAALGSTRDKPDEEYCKKVFEVFQKHNIRYFFYAGGNDSSDTARIIRDMGVKSGYDLKVFHIPKTVDNDLCGIDHCPGFGSAAKFVAQAIMGDNQDSRSLPGIKIDVIMGRHAGFLTAAAALARQNPGDGPHLVYVPERNVSMEQFISDVKAAKAKYGRCLVAVSEGIHDENGTPWAQRMAENVEKDAHGNIQLSGSGALGDFLIGQLKKAMPGERMRADTFGYLQRSFAGIVSEVDATEARECGRLAVKWACTGERASGSVSFKRISSAPYRIEYYCNDLENVAAKTKYLPDEFINEAGNNITDAFIEYALPLVGELPQMGFIAG
ncbi:MAG: 6-phosphofructokinase [Phycisphaerae bacterium]|nr:6-phosphofructokinase [Phycisphaerae bacterium]